MKWLLGLIVFFLSTAAELLVEGHAASNVIHADLDFHFVCEEKDRSTIEHETDNFLREQGFREINLGRLQREHRFFSTELKIAGIDDRRRIIDVTAVPSGHRRYSISLTPPPTKHARQLEDALMAFASSTIGCDLRQVARGENAVDAAEFYNLKIKRVENLFREEEMLRGERRL
jgi:hypothetical protein